MDRSIVGEHNAYGDLYVKKERKHHKAEGIADKRESLAKHIAESKSVDRVLSVKELGVIHNYDINHTPLQIKSKLTESPLKKEIPMAAIKDGVKM